MDVIYTLEGQFPGDDKIKDYIQKTPSEEKSSREKTDRAAKFKLLKVIQNLQKFLKA